ncbi:MAG: hypothetical protein QOK36_2066 [Gaiellales bacterium]|nr:hypothetical protein [Gaiellales bacterium]
MLHRMSGDAASPPGRPANTLTTSHFRDGALGGRDNDDEVGSLEGTLSRPIAEAFTELHRVTVQSGTRPYPF